MNRTKDELDELERDFPEVFELAKRLEKIDGIEIKFDGDRNSKSVFHVCIAKRLLDGRKTKKWILRVNYPVNESYVSWSEHPDFEDVFDVACWNAFKDIVKTPADPRGKGRAHGSDLSPTTRVEWIVTRTEDYVRQLSSKSIGFFQEPYASP